MAFTFIAGTGIGGGPSGPGPTPAINTSGANLIVLIRYFANTLSFSDPTDNKGNTYTRINTGSNATAAGQCELWYCANTLNPVVGSGHTFTENAQFGGLSVGTWSGAATSSALDTNNNDVTANSGTTINSGSVTASGSGELYIAGIGLLNGPSISSYSINSSFTIRQSLLPLVGASGYQGTALADLATTGAQNPQWSGWASLGSVGGVGTIATFKGAGGGGIVIKQLAAMGVG